MQTDRYRLPMATPTAQSAWARNIDASYPSNVFAVVGFVVALVALGGKALIVDDLSLIGAAFASVAVFLGWAIGRELDPDTPWVANIALIAALIAALFFTPAALATGVVLIAVRSVAGTVGSPLSRLDLFVVAGLAAFAAFDPVLWIAGLAVLAWLVRAPEVGDLRSWGVGAFAAGAAGGLGFLWYQWSTDALESIEVTGTAYALAAVAGLAMLLAARPLAVTSLTDSGSGSISWMRVRSARIAAGASCMWAAVIGGVDGFWSIGPVFAALAVAAVFRVFVQSASKPA